MSWKIHISANFQNKTQRLEEQFSVREKSMIPESALSRKRQKKKRVEREKS
jgi:hypothetical protein